MEKALQPEKLDLPIIKIHQPLGIGGNFVKQIIAVMTALAMIVSGSVCLGYDKAFEFDSLDKLEEFQVSEGPLRLNNFMINEVQSETITEFGVVSFTLSVMNKSAEKLYIGVQLVGLGQDGLPRFTVTGNSANSYPNFMIKPQSSDTWGGNAYISSGDLAKCTKFWLKIMTEVPNE